MLNIYRAARVSTALICLAFGVFLLADSGLPRRADFTGEVVDGQHFAPETGAFAPLFEQTTLAGDTLSLLELRGSPVILNFWATWCVPCRVEMPALQNLHDRYHMEGLRIIGVNLGESQAAMHDWINDLNLTFTILPDPAGVIVNQYYLLGQPSTYVIAPDGRIINVFYGPVPEDQLRSALRPYL